MNKQDGTGMGPHPLFIMSPAVFDSGALILEEQCLVRTSTNTAKVSQNIALPLCTGTADDPTSYHSSSLESSLVMEKFVSKNWGGGTYCLFVCYICF